MKITCGQCGELFEDIEDDGFYECLTLTCYVRNMKREQRLQSEAERRKAEMERIMAIFELQD